MERIIHAITKIDAEDTHFGLYNLMNDIILILKKQENMMVMGDVFAYLGNNCSLVDSYRYLAALLNKVSIASAAKKYLDFSVIAQIAEHNLKLIARINEIRNLKKYFLSLYS